MTRPFSPDAGQWEQMRARIIAAVEAERVAEDAYHFVGFDGYLANILETATALGKARSATDAVIREALGGHHA